MMRRLVGVAIVHFAFSASAEDVKLQDVPAPVRATIEKKVGNNKIEDLERENRHGTIVFEVEFEDADQNDQGLLIAEDGRVIEEWQKSTP